MASTTNFNFVNVFPKFPVQSKPIPLPNLTFPVPGGFCCCYKQHLSNSSSSSITQVQEGRRSIRSSPVSMFSDDLVIHDYCVAAAAGATALFLLWFWGQVAKQGVFDQKLNRKFVHITIGLVFMLFWPLFSSRPEAAILAALIPGVNIIKMLLLGLGVYKDEATVKSMTRFGDHRELLKGPLYYATTITLASIIYWRSSPIPIAAICNMCAGDGMADIIGRRFGKHKLPYNKDKSFMGSIAMVGFGFMACIGYMLYFSAFGLIDESWNLSLQFFIVSLASALVESLPISSDLDDNLTVPLTSFLVGTLLF
ncbi:farnesol kinase [Ranunculus cassubicifolius]